MRFVRVEISERLSVALAYKLRRKKCAGVLYIVNKARMSKLQWWEDKFMSLTFRTCFSSINVEYLCSKRASRFRWILQDVYGHRLANNSNIGLWDLNLVVVSEMAGRTGKIDGGSTLNAYHQNVRDDVPQDAIAAGGWLLTFCTPRTIGEPKAAWYL